MKNNYYIDTDRHDIDSIVLKGNRLTIFCKDGTFENYKITQEV